MARADQNAGVGARAHAADASVNTATPASSVVTR
jgi:hypothetical protein